MWLLTAVSVAALTMVLVLSRGASVSKAQAAEEAAAGQTVQRPLDIGH
ncbi:hypothetical protein NKH77_51760 [Streptomyces sp. M19]